MSVFYNLSTWFLLFIIYSIIGWIMEVIVTGFLNQKLSNRGFLIGPICPIYGVGALFITLALGHIHSVLLVFLLATLGCGVLEYFTSYIMEKLFHVRWWDYSDRPLNIRGRVCAENLACFGLLGVLVLKVLNPLFFGFLNWINPTARLIIAAVALLILLVDIGLSLWLIIVCRVTVGTVELDATDEITAKVRETLMRRGKLNRRLVKAFPEMTAKKKTPSKRKRSSKTSKAAKATRQSPSKTSQTKL